MKPKKRVAFYTFGCRLNQAETALIQQGFSPECYQLVDHRDSPDVLVVNTCTVTENGDADARRLVRKVSRKNPAVEIAMVGCQAQVQREKLLELPNVKWVVGNGPKIDTASIIETRTDDGPTLLVPTIKRESFRIPFVGYDTRHKRANLKIQDGCDFFCSFCEIPYARGRARSREFDNIIEEAQALAKAGHHELVLTGINLGTYEHKGRSLSDVLRALEQIDDLWRIRISSIEPTTIDDSVLHIINDSDKMCRYLHIPLQAGSDDVLKGMQRKYTVSEFRSFLTHASAIVPGACLGTDVIVGFPGETDAHFDETLELLRELPFAYFHVFSYSDRDHARSSKFDPATKVDRQTIATRSRVLRELSDRKRTVFMSSLLGQTEPVLFEQEKHGFWTGLTDTYARVKVRSASSLSNRMLPVRLDRLEGQAIIGELCS